MRFQIKQKKEFVRKSNNFLDVENFFPVILFDSFASYNYFTFKLS